MSVLKTDRDNTPAEYSATRGGGKPGEFKARAIAVTFGLGVLLGMAGCSKPEAEPDPFYRVLANYSQCVGSLRQSNEFHEECNSTLRLCIDSLKAIGGAAADGGAR